MRYAMPNPELINGNYYLRLHVPKDVASIAKGMTLQVPVGDHLCPATVGSVVKVSLRTKVYDEAKKRFTNALAAIERQWEALRRGPASIPHKTLVALAGQHYRRGVEIVEDKPGEPTVWEAMRGLRERLDASPEARQEWYGPTADALFAANGLNADMTSRLRLIEELHSAAKQSMEVNSRKAKGDYEQIKADEKANWVNQTENDWESLIPVADKKTKSGAVRGQDRAIFKLFSLGVSTNRDEWVYDYSAENLSRKMQFFCREYDDALINAKELPSSLKVCFGVQF